MRTLSITCVLAVSLAVTASAQTQTTDSNTAEQFEARLGYQTGVVTVRDGLATLKLPPSFRFLGPDSSRRVLVEAWGNPPQSADAVLGMLIPTATSPMARDGWGVVITYEEDGYVDDADAGKIDYAQLLKEMQESSKASNDDRKKQGFDTVTLIGWAEPPSYDKAAHKLYWAKELQFGNQPGHTLNYSIRVLGRRGVLVLNAVAGIEQLSVIHDQTPQILSALNFNEGHRYTDYLPGSDKAAAYGLTGLIVGATAAKAGLFKLLLAGLLAFKKALLVAIVAAGAWLKRLFVKPTAPVSEQETT
jgi:uncharacterized membrane-anchored protein